MGADAERIRNEVVRLLAGRGRAWIEKEEIPFHVRREFDRLQVEKDAAIEAQTSIAPPESANTNARFSLFPSLGSLLASVRCLDGSARPMSGSRVWSLPLSPFPSDSSWPG